MREGFRTGRQVLIATWDYRGGMYSRAFSTTCFLGGHRDRVCTGRDALEAASTHSRRVMNKPRCVSIAAGIAHTLRAHQLTLGVHAKAEVSGEPSALREDEEYGQEDHRQDA